MPFDTNGQHYVDMVTPQPLDIAGAVNALASATPEARQRFLADRKSAMDPQVFAAGVAALYGASKKLEQGGQPGGGPSGTPNPGLTFPADALPVPPDDPDYQRVLAASGCRYPSQQFTHDPSAGRR